MIKEISKGKNHKAIEIGALDNLSHYTFKHPKTGSEDTNRLFVGEHIESSGSEISFRNLSPNTTIPFLHGHHKHEEIYIFIKGVGKFQVDDEVFEVKEGSIIKVDPDGLRTLSNTGDKEMVYMVVQSLSGGLQGYNIADGFRKEGEIKI